ncbi:hypothetical protein CAL12_02185 [Bordetella genomosp. 8]|uniref:DUF4148 domain-containing protein n=1 Tax=Bordetella genomosp. 8 TaxID=1416806 RepID=A0A1W6YFF5_9BORD|nr:His-Xaa-Ser repeat protein HxsA2 [Bordetella genomosp. 8]ARP79750.1 hypothetical protein CAL12_02185 [Bordetella genomosp. 8]
MKKFAFLVPVATAAAALGADVSASVPPQTATLDQHAEKLALDRSASTISELTYVKGNELHALTMRRSEAGQLFAQHRSHASHSSHSSHQSHRSGS